MSSGKQHISRWISILAWGVIAILIVLIGARFFLQTNLAHAFIENRIERIIAEEMEAVVQIGSVSGDTWELLIIENLSIARDEDYVIIDRIEARYIALDLIFGDPMLAGITIDGVESTIDIGNYTPQKIEESGDDEQKAESSFSINRIEVVNANFELNSEEFLPDSTVTLNQFEFLGSVRIGDINQLVIQSLGFEITHGQLPEPIQIGVDGTFSDTYVGLNEIVLGIGRSAIDGRLSANFNNNALDGIAYSEEFSTEIINKILSKDADLDDLRISVALEGQLDDFKATLNLESPQLQNTRIVTEISRFESYGLKSFSIQSDYINTMNLLDSLQFSAGPMFLGVNGEITKWDSTVAFDWALDISNLVWNGAHLKRTESEGEFLGNELNGSIRILAASGEKLDSEIKLTSFFSESPAWSADFFVQHLNPKNWDNELPDANLNLAGTISGASFSIPGSGLVISASNAHPETDGLLPLNIGADTLNQVTVSLEMDEDRLLAEAQITVKESVVAAEIQAINPLEESVEYTYQVQLEGLNIGYFERFSGNRTQLTGSLYGIGNGTSPETANIFGTLSLFEGEINNAVIESFEASVSLESGILNVKEGNLKSDIADGQITGLRDLMDVANPDNQLNLDLNLKDIQPVAGLVGLEIMQAYGNLVGDIFQDSTGNLLGNFDLQLDDVLVDSLFQAEEVNGNAFVNIETKRRFDANLEIQNPIISGLIFEDIDLRTAGFLSDDSLAADFELVVVGSERGQLVQSGFVSKDIEEELADIRFDQFDFLSPESDLLLQKPFNIRFFQNAFGTDTLELRSEEDARLEFAVPYASENEQRAFMNGINFDLGLIQEIVFGQRFLDGVMSGSLLYHQTPEDIVGNGFARIENLNYKDATADSVLLSFDIMNERLDANGNIFWDSTLAVTGWANLPFVINRKELDDEFFTRPVRGELSINPTNLDKFRTILGEAGVDNTTGMASFTGAIDGTAGEPFFNGLLEVEDPIISGVTVDRTTAQFVYSNPTRRINVQGEIFAANTSAAEVTVAYPLDVDFRTFELSLPGEKDEVEINAVSNDLNLALFNDFLDPNYVAELRGELTADIEFRGPIGGIEPQGFLRLNNGRFEVPYSGIQVDNFSLQADVNESILTINRLYAESGPGRMSATGEAVLDGITLTEILLDTDARLFQLANTRDLNLVVNWDATMSGQVERPELIGDVIINHGFYVVNNFGEEAIEEVILEDEDIRSFAPFDSLTIDMIVEFGNQFFIRSTDYLDLEMEPVGLLDIAKERNGEVLLFGTLGIEDGYIRPLGKRFSLDQSTVTFIGENENPELAIRSSYIPQTRQKGESVILYYLINGTREEPVFTFESDPQMEQSDVICYTLFNQPCYALESWQSVFAEGNDAQAFQAISDVLLDEVETIATRELGVDVVQIDNSGQNGATAIRTGWYLNERTFFSIINEITSSTPKTLFVLEYLLNENWDLIITQGDDARQGIDLRYQFDY